MKLRERLKNLKAEQEKYNEAAATMSAEERSEATAKFKDLRSEIVDELREGANPCPDCGNLPHAIFHDGTPNPFELGCLTDANHRVRAALPEDAVAAWNEGDYLPPREPETVVATHADATGKVISQKTVKIQR